MTLVSEVHPFADGKDRIAQIMMNAELPAHDEERIIVPTAYRTEYLSGLTAFWRNRQTGPLIRMLDVAQAFTHRVDWSTLQSARDMLMRSSAFDRARMPNFGQLEIGLRPDLQAADCDIQLEIDDQMQRLFGTDDLGAVSPDAMARSIERIQVELGLETDKNRRVAMWSLLFMLGSAPDLSVASKDKRDRDAARAFMDLRGLADADGSSPGSASPPPCLDDVDKFDTCLNGLLSKFFFHNLPFRTRRHCGR